jgi:DNA (cytosine-5)-methyltransferase 1
LEGNGTRPSHKGSGFRENVSFNLNCVERHAVAYEEKETDATYAMTTGSYTQVCKEQAPCLQARDYKDAPVVQVAVENYQHSGYREVETAGTLKASGGDYPGGENIIIENSYVVRRLVPQECALLQGFPANYCADLKTPNPTEEDIAWWAEVFETHRKAMGKTTKPKSRNQIIKWLKNPYTDSAEYKLWGNGIALPCGYFVISGIVWARENL